MPKRYADSIAYDLRKYDQLRIVHEAQKIELVYAYGIIDNQTEQINELDSLNSDNVKYYEEVVRPKQRKRLRIASVVVGVETLLLILILL